MIYRKNRAAGLDFTRMEPRFSLRRWVVAACAAVLLLGAPRAVHAQMGAMKAMTGMQTPSIGARQVKQYEEILGLSPEQRKAAEELLVGYETDFHAAVRRLEDITKAMQAEFTQSGDLKVYQEILPDVMKKFSKRVKKIEQGMLDDLKALLDDKQASRWALVERAHRRNTTISWGTLSGESVDLADIVAGLRLDSAGTAAVAPILEQYDADLDKALIARNTIMTEQMDSAWDRMMSPDFEKMKKDIKDLKDAGRPIVELNKRYVRQIEGVLPTENREQFNSEVRTHSYPTVYRKPYAMRVLEAAEKLADLDAGQRDSLKSLKESYLRDVTAANTSWAGAIDEQEADDSNPFAAWAGAFGQQEQPGKIKDAKEERKRIDEKTIESIKQLLNEAQRAKLPDQKSRPEFDYDAAPQAK